MSDRAALIAAICARPREDVPRLAFADWLDEYGDDGDRDWATFIRTDIARRALGEYDPVRLRWELIEKHEREAEPWARDRFGAHAAEEGEPLLSRGFPWFVPTDGDELLAGEPELAAAVPCPVFALGESSPALADAFATPHLSRAVGLRLRNTILELPEVHALSTSRHVPLLTELDAIEGGIRPDAVQALLDSSLFPRLELLSLNEFGWGGNALARAIAAVRASALDALMLGAQLLAPNSLAALLDSPVGRGLRRLMLDSCALGRAGAAELGAAAEVTELMLGRNDIRRGGFAALLSSPLVGRLRALDVSRNGLDALSVEALGDHPGAGALRALCLADNEIGDAGAAALFRSPHLAGVLVLDLSFCALGDAGVRALLDSPLCDSLVMLELEGCTARAELLSALAQRMGDRVRPASA